MIMSHSIPGAASSQSIDQHTNVGTDAAVQLLVHMLMEHASAAGIHGDVDTSINSNNRMRLSFHPSFPSG